MCLCSLPSSPRFDWHANRREPAAEPLDANYPNYVTGLNRRFAICVVSLLLFLFGLSLAEQWGLKKVWVAPYLRQLGLYTVPDYFGLRFGGRWRRLIAAFAAVLCSFTYVVAQIYGVGLITSRLTGVQFEIGILLGLGGVLVCSYLGGMRAVTWTQVAQYVVLILWFLIPASWLAYKQLGNPLAPFVYGQQL